ncbi:MAG: hypothetical protein HQK83_11340 [Fibrobacteria bacterium]|nr:hypothetical protein [Fibrobacteria bacterium]
MKIKFHHLSICIIGMITFITAKNDLKPQVEFSPSAYAAFQSGQIVNGKFQGEDLVHPSWMQSLLLNFSMHTSINKNLEVITSFELATKHNTFPLDKIPGVYEIPKVEYEIYPHQAEGVYTFHFNNKPLLKFAAGLTPYKYNANVKNLGEYLFRSGTYPGYLLSNFELAYARITGIRLMTSCFENWENELLFTTRTGIPPWHDMNLTYITKYRFGNVLQIGAGIQFAHIISVNDTLTTPKNSYNNNAWFNWAGSPDTMLPSPGDYWTKDNEDQVKNIINDGYVLYDGNDSLPAGAYWADSDIPAIKAFADDSSTVVSFPEYSQYTYKGTKLMLMFSFDPKSLFSSEVFGPEDLKFYGEAALLGLKKYPVFYEKWQEKIPIMFGFNIPVFNLLDHLALEVEWYGFGYPNDYKNNVVPNRQTAVPSQPQGDYLNFNYDRDNWKWSIHASKTITPGFSIIAQAARDHLRHNFQFEQTTADRETLLVKPGHWYWMVRFMFGI